MAGSDVDAGKASSYLWEGAVLVRHGYPTNSNLAGGCPFARWCFGLNRAVSSAILKRLDGTTL
jgi:hypothetical protein